MNTDERWIGVIFVLTVFAIWGYSIYYLIMNWK